MKAAIATQCLTISKSPVNGRLKKRFEAALPAVITTSTTRMAPPISAQPTMILRATPISLFLKDFVIPVRPSGRDRDPCVDGPRCARGGERFLELAACGHVSGLSVR